MSARILHPDVRRIGATEDSIGETPVWREDEAALYWIDCDGPPRLRRWESDCNEVTDWIMPSRVGGFVFKREGGALVTLSDGIYDFDFESAELDLRVKSPLGEHVALHECACDPSGRFWVGSIDHRVGPDNLHPGGAKLFRLDGNELVPVIEDISCANGLAFSPDGNWLYISDSTTMRCDRYPLTLETGEVGEPDTFFELGQGEGFVDGAAVDAEGAYWACLVYSGMVRRYLPDGTVDRELRLPFANPTKLAFGGEGLTTMYLTTIRNGLDGQQSTPLDGGLYSIVGEHAGRPETVFAG